MLQFTHKDKTKTKISTVRYSNPCEVFVTCLGKVQAEPGVCTEFCKTELRREPREQGGPGLLQIPSSWCSEREWRVCDAGWWLRFGSPKHHCKKYLCSCRKHWNKYQASRLQRLLWIMVSLFNPATPMYHPQDHSLFLYLVYALNINCIDTCSLSPPNRWENWDLERVGSKLQILQSWSEIKMRNHTALTPKSLPMRTCCGRKVCWKATNTTSHCQWDGGWKPRDSW